MTNGEIRLTLGDLEPQLSELAKKRHLTRSALVRIWIMDATELLNRPLFKEKKP
jgi:hypothetical protein